MRKFRKTLTVLVSIQVSLLILYGVSYSKDTIKLGTLLPYSGTYFWVGKGAGHGLNLAVNEINNAGGPLGCQITLIKRDTDATAEKSRNGMKALVYDEKVLSIIGPTSITIFDCMDIAQKEGIVLISPTAGTTKLDNQGGKYIFRTTSSDNVMGLAMGAEAILSGLQKGAIMYPSTGSGKSIAEALKNAFPKVGGEIVTTVMFQENKSSYIQDMETLFSKKPEVVFFEMTPADGKTIFNEFNKMGIKVVWIGADMMNNTFVEEVSKVTDIEGMIGVVPAPKHSARLDKWKKDMNTLTGAEGIPPFSAQAYDAVNLISLAIEAGGMATRKSIVENLRKVTNPPGIKVYNFAEGATLLRQGREIDYIVVSGTMEFNKFGDVVVDHVVTEVKNKKRTQIGVFTQDDLAKYAK